MSQPHPSLDILRVDDLTEADLPAIAWSGGPEHLASVARYLSRAASGEVEYLAVRAPDGRIVAKGGIDYTEHPGYGTILQLAANPTGHGYGTLLIQAMEARIRARGLDAMLGVEPDNPILARSGSTSALATASAAPKTPPGRPPTPTAAASCIARP